MNFVAQIEDYLRDLGAEARKKHPGVKEASERAILKLRTLQTAYVSAVRRASNEKGAPHPTTALFQSQDLLHPFVLAANYPNASYKLVDISLKAMRTLMEGNAICPGDGLHMVRVWMIQAHVCHSTLSKHLPHSGSSSNVSGGGGSGGGGSSNTISSSSAASSSSWFGFSLSSSSSYDVSSSAGHAGGSGGTKKPECEKIALEILSCLVQLLEQQDLRPATEEQWTQSVALVCLLWNIPQTKVKQAAHSTLPQVLAILYNHSHTATSNQLKFMLHTWEDLLAMTTSSQHHHHYSGAFAQCVSNNSKAAGNNSLPTPEFALELMTKLLRQYEQNQQPSSQPMDLTEQQQVLLLQDDQQTVSPTNNSNTAMMWLLDKEAVRSKTFGVLLQLLQTKMSVSLELTLRIVAFVSAVVQTLSTSCPNECRELIQILIKYIVQATEACRTQDDFEDGYVYYEPPPGQQARPGIGGASSGGSSSTIGRGGRRDSWDLGNPSAANNMNSITMTPPPLLASASSPMPAAAASVKRIVGGNKAPAHSTLISNTTLWKAGLALEALYPLLPSPNRLDCTLWEEDSLALLSEAMSDFCTIVASCQDHILQLIEATYRNSNSRNSLINNNSSNSSIQWNDSERKDSMMTLTPVFYRKAEQLLTSGSNHSSSNSHTTSSSAGMDSSSSGKASGGNETVKERGGSRFPPCDIGQALWIAFHSVLRITEILHAFAPTKDSESKQQNAGDDTRNEFAAKLLEASFAPALAALQHYLKRFPGSAVLTQLTLQGYANLASLALPAAQSNVVTTTTTTTSVTMSPSDSSITSHHFGMQRKALLTSLSKLSLPAWGKRDASGQLTDCHVDALMCLLQIVHKHYDRVLSEWHVVLATLEELSILSIASPLLSDRGYEEALAISAIFGRLAAFSTCLSDESLLCMVDALAEVSASWSSWNKQDVIQIGGRESDTVVADKPSGADGERRQLQEDTKETTSSIGGKLMSLGVRAIYGSQLSDTNEITPLDKPVAERTKTTYQEDYRADFSKKLASFNSTMRADDMSRIPFALMTLIDIAASNSFRYKECGAEMSRQMCSLAGKVPEVRAFAMDTVATLALSHLSMENSTLTSCKGPGKIIFDDPKPNQLLVVEKIASDQMKTYPPIAQETILSPLCDFIKTTEDSNVAEAGIGALRSILENAGHTLTGEVWIVVITAISSLSGDGSSTSGNRTLPDWSNCCLLAFRCLKLIVDDLLEQIPRPTDPNNVARSLLLDCCSAFGRSRHDVNTSLTAIGLLWTLADQDAGMKAIDLALAKLVLLAADNRPEVRNCSVNTLFSCIVGRGNSFSPSQWKMCLVQTIFGVYDQVLSKGGKIESSTNEKPSPTASSSRYKVAIHHSRDSADKQWMTTQVLVLRGLNRVLRLYFSQLLDTLELIDKGDTSEESHWFEGAWSQILDFALDAAQLGGGRDTLEVRTCGVDLMVLCAQLSCRAGVQAAITPARVGTNMEVVNGALKSVRESVVQKDGDKRPLSTELETWREDLFLEAFDVLDDFHKHVLGSTTDEDESHSTFVESTRVQVLHKFSTGLAKLYDCCRDDELSAPKPDQTDGSMTQPVLLESSTAERDKDELEGRFVDIIATIAKSSSSGPSSRFLSQAQRCCVDLLKTMSVNGSGEALKTLTSLSGISFMWTARKEVDDDGDDDEKDVGQSGTDLLCREAGSVVAEVIASDRIAPYIKVQVLSRVLRVLLSEGVRERSMTAGGATGKKEPKRKRCYKLFVPVLQEGLCSASMLEQQAMGDDDNMDKQELRDLLNVLWERLCNSLAQMLSPVPVAPHVYRIPLPSSLIEILTATSEHVPNHHRSEYCNILSSGASKSMEIAISANSSPLKDGDAARKLKKLSEEALSIFKSCFNGICQIQPDNAILPGIAERGLNEAIKAIEERGSENETTKNAMETVLIICQAMRSHEKMDTLIISVFSQLCRLISVENGALRSEIGQLLGTVDVAKILDEAKHQRAVAEQRAEAAEQQVVALKSQLKDLRATNESLQQQVSVFTASTLLT